MDDLYKKLATEAISIIMGWVNTCLGSINIDSLKQGFFPIFMVHNAETYFNDVAKWICTGKNEQINAKFDDMLKSCPWPAPGLRKYGKFDLLDMLFRLTMQFLVELSFDDITGGKDDLELLQKKLHVLADKYSPFAKTMIGTNEPEPPHNSEGPIEKLYPLEYKKSCFDGKKFTIEDTWIELE